MTRRERETSRGKSKKRIFRKLYLKHRRKLRRKKMSNGSKLRMIRQRRQRAKRLRSRRNWKSKKKLKNKKDSRSRKVGRMKS